MSDDEANSTDRTPLETVVEHAVDTFVYAPIGLLFEGTSLLPELVEKGRSQVTMARMIGKFAVEQGRGEAVKAASKLQDQAAGLLDFIGGSLSGVAAEPAEGPEPAPTRTGVTRPAKAPGSARAAARAVVGVTGSPEAASPAAPLPAERTAPPVPVGSADDLAIPDYDGLSASHVVNRLAGLSAAELEAVRAYEASHRGRKTILSKVAQLQAS